MIKQESKPEQGPVMQEEDIALLYTDDVLPVAMKRVNITGESAEEPATVSLTTRPTRIMRGDIPVPAAAG